MGGDAMLSNFYDQLKHIREYFRRFPDAALMVTSSSEPSQEGDETKPTGKVKGIIVLFESCSLK